MEYKMKNIVKRVVKHVVLITIASSLLACGGGGSGEVTKPANQAPVVMAGDDQSITLPDNSVSLSASVNDDGDSTALWTLKSGTGSVIFSDSSALSTSADFSNSGVYTLTLIVNDGDFVVSDDVVITISDAVVVSDDNVVDEDVPNQTLVVIAGEDQSITLPNTSVNLVGSVEGGDNTSLWTLKSGEGSVVFADEAAVGTSVEFTDSGVYTLTLTANADNVVSDDVIITVNDMPNQAPVVIAGEDQNITLPTNSVNLVASVEDDGDYSVLWTLKSGDGNVVFADDSVLNTRAEFSASGVYTLTLTATDSDFFVSEDVVITVNGILNQAPVVVAGEDQSTTLFNNSVNLVASVEDDGDFSVLWTQASDEGSVIFTDDSAVNTSVEFSDSGIYTLRLTVDDGTFIVSDDVIVTVTSNLDSFGITKFYPTTTGFTDWQSTHWHNGNARTISYGRDTEDVTGWSQKRGDDDLTIDGNGILEMGGGNQPRLYINPYPESDEVNPEQFFKNVEATVYYKRLGDDGAANGGLVIGLRSGPNGHSVNGDYCDATTYYGRLRHDGYVDFYKELKHSQGKAAQQTKLYTSGVLPSQQWLGMKFIAYNINNDSQVKLKIYIDNSSDGDVSNGGEWELVGEMIDEGNWRVSEDVSSCTYSDNHIITTGGGAVLIRNTGIASAEYKFLSVREIDAGN